MAEIASLHVYPVKSCRGHSLERVGLDAFGLAGDRRFLVVDAGGRFLSQRDTPRLALVSPEVRGGRLSLQAPGAPRLEILTRPDGAAFIDVQIWRDTCHAVDLGAGAAGWLTRFLEKPARLVAMAADFARPVRKPAAQPGDQVAFNDAHPLLVIGEASLADLDSRLAAPLPMERFRPNLVVRGSLPYEEDRWRRVRIGECILRASGPCSRCVVTTTDQQTLERGAEPLRALALYRRGSGGEVWFGQNYINETKVGELAAGMPVEVLE